MGGREGRVERAHLSDRMGAALQRGSVVVVAPAGYGKTTLIEQVLVQAHGPGARLSCTDADRDPRHLLLRVVSAVADTVEGASDELRDRLLAATAPLDPRFVLRGLLEDLDHLLIEPIVLVLDEAEQLAHADRSLTIVSELLRHGKGSLRSVVISRRELDLPVARLRVQGTVEAFGAGDLAFDASECASMLELATGGPAPDGDLDALVTATEGWPLAVAAVCRQLADGTDASVASLVRGGRLDTTANVRRFLVEEVLAGVDPPLRDHLVASSVPRLLTPGIVAELGLPSDFLQRARASGVFLLPADGHADAFAYHPLFRECLLEQLATVHSQDGIAALHRAAGRAMADAGTPVEAVEHLLTAGEPDEAAAMLVSQGDELLVTAPQLVRDWLERLPAEVRARPALEVIAGRLAWGSGDFDRAIAALRSAVAHWPADQPGQWQVRYVLMQALYLRGDIEEAVVGADGFEQASGDDVPAAAAAGMYAAHCLAALGRAAVSVQVSEAARRRAPAGLVAPLDVVRRLYVDVPAGRLDAAIGAATEMAATLQHHDPLLVRPGLLTGSAFALALQGRLEEALDRWRRVELEARESLFDFAVGPARACQATLLVELGRVGEAESVLAPVDTAGWGWSAYMVHVAQAALASARGDRERSLSTAGQAETAAAVAPPLFRALAASDLVMPLVRVGAFDRASAVMSNARRAVDEAYPDEAGVLLVARFAVLEAIAEAADGHGHASDEALARAFAAAGDSTVAVLRRDWGELDALVWSALERGVLEATAVADALTRAFPDGLALVPFVDHPIADVRRWAIAPAFASGHPDGLRRVGERRDDPDPDVARAAARLTGSTVVATPFVFTLLGGFAVTRGSWTVDAEAWGRPVAARLVRYLLLAGSAVAGDVLAEAFWPDLDAPGGRRSLQVAVSRVRGALDPPGATHSIIESRDGTYRLRLGDRDVVDAVEYRRVAVRALEDPTVEGLKHAASQWTGEPLPEERYSDWATAWRERLVEQHAAVLSTLVELQHAAGDHRAATRPARELVALDPFDEGAHRTLMVAYARAGRRSAALRQYLECRRLLVGELDVEPDTRTLRLRARIVSGDPV